jgi:hypothetical protein
VGADGRHPCRNPLIKELGLQSASPVRPRQYTVGVNRYAWLLAALPLLLSACGKKPAPQADPADPVPVESSAPPQGSANKPPVKPSQPEPEDLIPKAKEVPGAFDPAPAGSQGWKPARRSAVELARAVDDNIANRKNYSWDFMLSTSQPEGISRTVGKGYVVNDRKFRYDYAAFGDLRNEFVSKNSVVADGSQISVFTRQGYSTPVSVGSLDRAKVKNILIDFPSRFSELFFAGIGTKSRPMTDFLTAVSKPGSGYKVVVEDKSVMLRDEPMNTQRILVTRPMNAAKKTKGLEMEIVFQADKLVPLSALVTQESPDGQQQKQSWGSLWHLQPNQKFDPKLFVIPETTF